MVTFSKPIGARASSTVISTLLSLNKAIKAKIGAREPKSTVVPAQSKPQPEFVCCWLS